MINFIVRVAVLVIPDDLTSIEEKEEDNLDFLNEKEKYLEYQISHNSYLQTILQGLEGIRLTSVLCYTLDFGSYNALYEMLVLSVKLSFAGDEINEKGECERILHHIWSLMCHKHTAHKIYSFCCFVRYKLQNKVNILNIFIWV